MERTAKGGTRRDKARWELIVPRIFLALVLALLPALAHAQTLEAVKARDMLRCATTQPQAGFAERDDEGNWTGFDVAICKAVAAAVLGDSEKVAFTAYPGQSRLAPLQTGEIDMMARNASWVMRRDTRYGVAYVGTSYFDGQGFIVRQTESIVSALELEGQSVCAVDESDELEIMRRFFFERLVPYEEVLYEDHEDLELAYRAGLCDAVTGPATWLYALRQALGDPAQHRILPERLSKEPMGPVVREGDDQWRNVVTWVLNALIDAEELGVNSVNVESMAAARNPAIRRLLGVEGDFGTALGLDKDWARRIITQVGNYGEIFERTLGNGSSLGIPRGRNSLWTKGGLLFAPPII